MPPLDEVLIEEGLNKLIHDELLYDKKELQHEHKKLLSTFTTEQKEIYDKILHSVSTGDGDIFFLYGYGGTGKTFIWRSLSVAIRSKGGIVLTVASSGIASLLIPGGRTTHSRFAIPSNMTGHSTCEIRPGTPFAELIAKSLIIILDEAPMTSKHCFEALDRSLRDVLRRSNPNSLEQPFGGKVIVFGGDFRQILPVVPKGTREVIVLATINSSYLWKHCKVLRLTRNMRLQIGSPDSDSLRLREFSEWILRVGDGTVNEPNDGEATIEIPDDLLIQSTGDPVKSIVEDTYPSLLDTFSDPTFYQDRTILAPTREIVDNINEYVMSLLPGDEKVYISSDSVCKTQGDEGLYSVDYLNTIKLSDIPNHSIRLKVGVPVMLLHNIDQSSGFATAPD